MMELLRRLLGRDDDTDECDHDWRLRPFPANDTEYQLRRQAGSVIHITEVEHRVPLCRHCDRLELAGVETRTIGEWVVDLNDHAEYDGPVDVGQLQELYGEDR